MNEKLKLPIGIENYKAVKQECFYFDRTMLISEILESPESSVFLFTRPRRFGKSLMMSMLSYFFDITLSSKPLFDDMEIAKHPAFYAEINTRPVIHLNLKGLTSASAEGFFSLLRMRMADLYRKCLSPELLERLGEPLETYAQEVMSESMPEERLQLSLERLERALCEIYGKTVVVLIDEYDAPLTEARENGYYERAQLFFKNFLGNALKGNDCVYKAVLTGVNQIAHASIFSDLNNLVVNNLLSGKNEYFGFAEGEVATLLSRFEFKRDLSEVREWYGGYRFQNQEVYNPWSILNFVSNHFQYRPYWVNTGSYSVLKGLLLEVGQQNIQELYSLLNGGAVIAPVRSSLSFANKGDSVSLYSLLLFSGYLTYEALPVIGEYSLFVPNREVRESLNSEILAEYAKDDQIRRLYEIKKALESGSNERFEQLFSDYLLSSFSAYDLNSEKTYQTILVTLSSMLFDDAIVKSEVNAGEGRCDISILDKGNRYCYVIELKYRKNRPSEDSLSDSAKSALAQILGNRYYEEAKTRGVPAIHLYGMAFSGKRVKVESMSLPS